MKKKTLITVTAAMLLSALLLSLAGCGGKTAAANPGDGAGSSGQGGSSEAEAVPGRQDGERFESVIIMEGMEETVKYEHIRNDSLGFEMDYDYELFERQSGSDRERFVSRYDDPNDPENYLEVSRIPRDAETAAAAVSAVLSLDYEISRDDSFPLERSGSCIRIDASAEKGGLNMPEHLRAVYIIPAADGCRGALLHRKRRGFRAPLPLLYGYLFGHCGQRGNQNNGRPGRIRDHEILHARQSGPGGHSRFGGLSGLLGTLIRRRKRDRGSVPLLHRGRESVLYRPGFGPNVRHGARPGNNR